jgi:hypothetical protein
MIKIRKLTNIIRGKKYKLVCHISLFSIAEELICKKYIFLYYYSLEKGDVA